MHFILIFFFSLTMSLNELWLITGNNLEWNAFKNGTELLSHEKSVSFNIITFKGVNSQDWWILKNPILSCIPWWHWETGTYFSHSKVGMSSHKVFNEWLLQIATALVIHKRTKTGSKYFIMHCNKSSLVFLKYALILSSLSPPHQVVELFLLSPSTYSDSSSPISSLFTKCIYAERSDTSFTKNQNKQTNQQKAQNRAIVFKLVWCPIKPQNTSCGTYHLTYGSCTKKTPKWFVDRKLQLRKYHFFLEEFR